MTKKLALILALLLSACKPGEDIPPQDAGTDASLDAGTDAGIATESNPWQGVWNVESMLWKECNFNSGMWECDEQPIPGPDGSGCNYLIEGFVSLEGTINGFGTIHIVISEDCTNAVVDGVELLVWYIFDPDTDKFLINDMDGGVLIGTIRASGDDVTLTLRTEEPTSKIQITLQLVKDDAGCTSTNTQLRGRCYALPDCEMRLQGCYVQDLCDYALQGLQYMGSFETDDGTCLNAPF